MTQDRIKDLANKGFITQVETVENLEKMSETELVAKGYITQTCVFDGREDTTEEEVIVVDTPTEVEPEEEPDDAPLVDDEPDDAPVDDDEMEDEIVVEGDTDAGVVEG